MDDKLLSVVIPAYNEEPMIAEAASVLEEILSAAFIEYEIIFVDDGSKDKTWKEICMVSGKRKSVRGLHFSRNFGKEAAIMAGLNTACGDCCVVMDCDLQHPPEKIVEMYRLWQEGYEVVEGRKNSRGDESIFHRMAADTFYALISKATGIDMSNASDFKLMDRKAVDVLKGMEERNAFFRALSAWIGFRTTTVEFDVQERAAGESKWSAGSLTKYALRNISSFSAMPMQIVTMLGAAMLVIALVLGGISLSQKMQGEAVEGFTTVILILLFTGSIIMISLGIIGYYIAKIYDEIKARPRYIVSETCGTMGKTGIMTNLNAGQENLSFYK